MSESLQHLNEALVEVLEEAAFTWADILEEAPAWPNDLWLARMTFTGAATGELLLLAGDPLLDLRDQRNTCDQDDSSVKYFSFIGDFEDQGRFAYYIDDLLVAAEPARGNAAVDAVGQPVVALVHRLDDRRSVHAGAGSKGVLAEHRVLDG